MFPTGPCACRCPGQPSCRPSAVEVLITTGQTVDPWSCPWPPISRSAPWVASSPAPPCPWRQSPPPEDFLAFVTDPAAVTAAQVSEATTRVLENPIYREAARRMAAAIAAAPPPASVVPWRTSLAGAA